MIDTHSHIYLPEFDTDRSEMIQRARHAGVEAIYMPNIDSSSTADMMALVQQYPGYCFPMMGLHPCSVRENFEKELLLVEKNWEANADFYSGVGECGLDYYWDKTFVGQQKEAFGRQIALASKYNKPIIIHSRDSLDDTIAMIDTAMSPELYGIFHCFSGRFDQLEHICAMGFYAGIGGVSTFKNGGLDKILEKQHLRHLVLETDAPYLSPVPFRGKRNEPAYLTYICDRLAEILQVSTEEVIETTNANAARIFNRNM
ncbi:MAG: TatD family hydrolase [Chitinophagales bacterium]